MYGHNGATQTAVLFIEQSSAKFDYSYVCIGPKSGIMGQEKNL